MYLQADVGVLQFQNQQLVQQIDLQKQALHDIEAKIGDLKYKQNSYDDMIIAVNELWSQVIVYHYASLPHASTLGPCLSLDSVKQCI